MPSRWVSVSAVSIARGSEDCAMAGAPRATTPMIRVPGACALNQEPMPVASAPSPIWTMTFVEDRTRAVSSWPITPARR